MEKPKPLSVGLLVSAMTRYDHGLFAPYFPDDVIGNYAGPPQEKIPKAMDAVIAIYDKVVAGDELETVTERQVAEEFFSLGFHSDARDEGYAGALEQYGLVDLAIERIGHRSATGAS